MPTALQQKVDRMPVHVDQSVDTEPPFPEPEDRWVQPSWGPYEHTEADLRSMWSRIWRSFKSHRLCEGYLQHHKSHSVDTWCAAFQEAKSKGPGEVGSIIYVMKIAGRYEVSETPNQRAEREAREQQERLAMKAMGTAGEVYTPSPRVKAYWAEQSRVRSVDEIPSDHPDVIRMMRKLKGDGRK